MYDCQMTKLVHENINGNYEWFSKPKSAKYKFNTDMCVPKGGVMLVGWVVMNGSTHIASFIVNSDIKKSQVEWKIKYNR